MNTPYQPIACSLHDRLEAAVTARKPVLVVYQDAQGATHEATALLKDVYSLAGEEFLVLESGERVRLDALIAVDGVRFGDVGTDGFCET